MMRLVLISVLAAALSLAGASVAADADSAARNLCTLKPLGGGQDDTDQARTCKTHLFVFN